MAASPPRSLKARALQALAQREQSRAELRRKLLQHARAEDRAAAAAAVAVAVAATCPARARADGLASGAAFAEGPSEAVDEFMGPGGGLAAAARVDAVLDWLESHCYLSNERFVESRVHARAPRFGNLRIRQELKQHQVQLSSQAAQTLSASEGERALQVLERKFAAPPDTVAERARRARFLAGRGFAPEAIRHALRHARRAVDASASHRHETAPDDDGEGGGQG